MKYENRSFRAEDSQGIRLEFKADGLIALELMLNSALKEVEKQIKLSYDGVCNKSIKEVSDMTRTIE